MGDHAAGHSEAEAGGGRAIEAERRQTSERGAIDEATSTLLLAVSHELRTPLSALLGLSLTLERDVGRLQPEEAAEIVRRIVANARKLDRLLADLLDINRLDRGILAPERRPVDVAALARRVVEEADLPPEREVAVEAPRELVASVDRSQVERIVDNLLTNAIRHTPPSARVWVKVRAEGDGTLIIVEDEGPGVPPGARRDLFEPFRAGASAHPAGTGVGLSLVRRFAGLHGGRAWVENRPGGGASFKVFLPD